MSESEEERSKISKESVIAYKFFSEKDLTFQTITNCEEDWGLHQLKCYFLKKGGGGGGYIIFILFWIVKEISYNELIENNYKTFLKNPHMKYSYKHLCV